MLDPQICYQALQARDERFDGRFFVGVVTTGIYCRPVCPAVAARPENCRFFPSAAAAQAEGFRPCLRCRPESAPDRGAWRGSESTVSRGLALIADGELDGEEASVEELAGRLGIGERQLRRLFRRHLGATPVAVAQTRRVLFAKQLIHETALPMAEIAFAAGFGSVRRFNEVFRALYRKPPSALRGRRTEEVSIAQGVTVSLRYRRPYDWEAMLAHLAARAIEGVERVDDGRYLRAAMHDGEAGIVEITHDARAKSLRAAIRFPTVGALSAVVTRLRRQLDVAADVAAIVEHLAADGRLAPLLTARPGLRVPGAWDGFELAVRAVVGQQITVVAARRLLGEIVRRWGAPAAPNELGLTHCFPSPETLAAADIEALGMPRARKRALRALARAALDDRHLFEPGSSLEETVARLSAIEGIGEWTAQTIALRASREPDAFPASDAGLLRGAAFLFEGRRPSPRELRERAEGWRPWRGYAAQHLWALSTNEGGSR